jgi:hypothetical protein
MYLITVSVEKIEQFCPARILPAFEDDPGPDLFQRSGSATKHTQLIALSVGFYQNPSVRHLREIGIESGLSYPLHDQLVNGSKSLDNL